MTPEEKLASGHQAKERPRILVFVDHYLPAFKFGGPVRTLANLVTHLGSRYDFFVFTRDRDQGDPSPYQQIALDRWVSTEGATVYYTADRSLRNISCRVDEIKPGLIYLNSFFSRVTIKILIARRFGWFSK